MNLTQTRADHLFVRFHLSIASQLQPLEEETCHHIASFRRGRRLPGLVLEA